MKIYNYNALKEYIGECEAKIDPLESIRQGKKAYLLPRNSTFKEVIKPIDGKKRIFLNGEWVYKDIIKEKTITWEDIRQQRDTLLRLTDWTHLADAPLTIEKIEQYKIYRQSLRDLPQNYENPVDVVFPIMS